jgi:hypothetical protein
VGYSVPTNASLDSMYSDIQRSLGANGSHILPTTNRFSAYVFSGYGWEGWYEGFFSKPNLYIYLQPCDGACTDATVAPTTTTTTLMTIPVQSGSDVATIVPSGNCSLQPNPALAGDEMATAQGTVTTPPTATSGGQVQLKVQDGSGDFLGQGPVVTLEGGAGTYSFTVNAYFPSTAQAAVCIVYWFFSAPTYGNGPGQVPQPPPEPTTTPTPTTYPPLP